MNLVSEAELHDGHGPEADRGSQYKFLHKMLRNGWYGQPYGRPYQLFSYKFIQSGLHTPLYHMIHTISLSYTINFSYATGCSYSLDKDDCIH